jgi:branched-chain amino acid aminotransferase
MEAITSFTEIKVTKIRESRIKEVDFEHLVFGKEYADHMLVADYNRGNWHNVEIIPFQKLSISPSIAALHYGQSIFEGIKAYKNQQGEPMIFRPYDNWERFNISADRMAMPGVPEEIFIEGMKKLVSLDRNWIPAVPGCSLYIRPFMFATDEFIGVKVADTYKFIIINSPAGPYFNKPIKLCIQDKYVRAFPGGTGFAKTAGNYGACMKPTQEVKEMGYDQILWTDGFEHKYLQECGTMNLFVIIGNTAITPDLSQGTILAGVTRSSAITLLEEQGLQVEERSISIDEVLTAHRNGSLKEIFGTGTAASVAFIEELAYHKEIIKFDPANWKVAPRLLKDMNDIKTGKVPDRFGWNMML